MKNRFFIVFALLVLLVTLTGNAQATSPGTTALVFVNIGSADDLNRFASTQLPMYSTLDGGLLAGVNQAGQHALEQTGLSFQVLDPDLRSSHYYLAETHSSRPTPDFSLYGQVLLETTSGVLLRMDPAQVDALTQAGAELRLITLTPKPLTTDQAEGAFPDVVVPDPLIQLMMDQVSTADIYQYDQGLAGEIPVWVDGEEYTIGTRYTYSGIPIQKATSYVGQHMADLGLDVEYHNWGGATYPNVIAELPGLINPDETYIIGGHVDDVQGAPGADDNASGSVATMIAADILTQYQWGCTLRFAVWTGEEQGLNGSAAYAQRAYQQGENIQGYLNLDMIAWNTGGSSPGIDLLYSSTMPPTLELAQLYADVVDAYDINLVPQLVTSLGGGSDHSSFWDYGYTSILAIEDQGDFNPYYHSAQDTTAHTDPEYFTDFVKASIGTFAHMSDCLIPNGIGSLDGHVTAEAGGDPIQGATVAADDGQGHSFPATTDESGYYTRTLLAGTYDVTASAYGYLPATINAVEVTTDTVTTRNFALTAVPTHTISGYVEDSVTQEPLIGATVGFTDSIPIDPVTTDGNGFYSIDVAEGTWHLKASAFSHTSESHTVVVDNDLTVDFSLYPLPCILLVDDDQDDPDVRAAYTSALDSLGYSYDIWDVADQGSLSAADLAGYLQLLWFNGYPYSGTFTGADEAAVASYLDAGGNLFLSSQDYLYEMGLTAFGQNYLHISSYDSDVSQTTVTGQNVFTGLGPYSLSYPFYNYSDVVNPDGQAEVAFNGNMGNAAVSFDGADFNTVFFGYPFEALPQAGREAVMGRLVDFFGSCTVPWAVAIYPTSQEGTGDPGSQVIYEFSVTNLGPDSQDILLSIADNTWLTEVPASTGLLASGAAATIPVTVTIPTSLEPLSDSFTLIANGVEGGIDTASGITTIDLHPGVEVVSPPEGSGRPAEIVSYAFTVTNTGAYTDSFTLETTGLWPVSLPGGNNTGPLAAGESTTINVLVEIPQDAPSGYMDVTILTATSDLDPGVSGEAGVTTTAVYVSVLPIMLK